MSDSLASIHGRFRLYHNGRDVRGFWSLPDALAAERQYRRAFTGKVCIIDAYAEPNETEV